MSLEPAYPIVEIINRDKEDVRPTGRWTDWLFCLVRAPEFDSTTEANHDYEPETTEEKSSGCDEWTRQDK